MRIEKALTSPKNYCCERTDKIRYIVIQDIGNRCSPHYHIVDGKALQIVPDHNMSNSVNGGRLTKFGTLHGICTKYNSISIGICENPTDEDIKMCIDLIMTIKQRYNIDIDKIIRQKDITGTFNPKKWWDDSRWNEDIINRINEL